jgi:hypothetical protein
MNKIVAYLDILGFGNHTYTNVEEALELLSDYQEIIRQKIIDKKSHPLSDYPEELQELAKQNMVDSFEYFLPFSDSLFIQSSSPNDFVKQISHFLLACFQLKANAYSYPEDPSDPSKITKKQIGKKNGKYIKKDKPYHWYPLIFRGGISYGETYIFDINAIVDSNLTKIKNIAGPALVKAVKELEPLGKGPRLFCDSDFVNQLDPETKKYCKKLPDKHYEILWPAFHYIKANNESEINKICELIRPVANLWKAYNHLPFGIHFWEFLRLVVEASIRYFEIQGNSKIAEDEISKCLELNGLKDKEGALKK